MGSSRRHLGGILSFFGPSTLGVKLCAAAVLLVNHPLQN
jgi:hypothetical protein